jgi:hypothetical protein
LFRGRQHVVERDLLQQGVTAGEHDDVGRGLPQETLEQP